MTFQNDSSDIFNLQIQQLKENEKLQEQINAIRPEVLSKEHKPAKDFDKIQAAVRKTQNAKLKAPVLTKDYPAESINNLYSAYDKALNNEQVDIVYTDSLLPIEQVLKTSPSLLMMCFSATLQKGTVSIKFKNIDIERKTLVEQGIIKYICESTEIMYEEILKLSELNGVVTDNIFKIELYTTSFIKAVFNGLLLLDNREFYTKTLGFKKFMDIFKKLIGLVNVVRLNENEINSLKAIDEEIKNQIKTQIGVVPSLDPTTVQKTIEEKYKIEGVSITTRLMFYNMLSRWNKLQFPTQEDYNDTILKSETKGEQKSENKSEH